jgi:hypothetical protein
MTAKSFITLGPGVDTILLSVIYGAEKSFMTSTPGPNVIKLFLSVIYELASVCPWQAFPA